MTALALFVGLVWVGICIDNGLTNIAKKIGGHHITPAAGRAGADRGS